MNIAQDSKNNDRVEEIKKQSKELEVLKDKADKDHGQCVAMGISVSGAIAKDLGFLNN